MRYFFTTLLLFSILLQLNGQETDKILNNLYRQLQLFPQEKVYLMTDKAAYVAGEQLWFRAFLTDVIAHRQDLPLSRYVYVDLIDPNGTVVKHHQIRPDTNGVFHNCIDLADDLAEGTYMLRSYTTFMRSRAEYIFEKKVYIADPQSKMIGVEPEFTFTRDREVSVLFRFRNQKDNSFISVPTVTIRIGESEPEEFPARRTISFKTDPLKDKYLYLTFTHNSKRHQRFIPIPYPANAHFDVSFFPEGGWLMENTPNRIGFKALRGDGLSEEITGEVYDSDDNHVASIKSLHAGMGSFILFPKAGEHYYALCTNKDSITLRFNLPTVQPNASVLRIIERKGQYLITALDNRINKEGGLFIIAHIRGMPLYVEKMPENNMVALHASDLPLYSATRPSPTCAPPSTGNPIFKSSMAKHILSFTPQTPIPLTLLYWKVSPKMELLSDRPDG